LAYGPGPEVELIPYFFSLLTWAGLSVVAVLLWPINALLRRFRKGRGAPKGGPPAAPAAAPAPPAPGEQASGGEAAPAGGPGEDQRARV
jgi:hypothetical protein